MKDKVRLRLKDAKTGKKLIQQDVGADLFRKTGDWNHLERYLNFEDPEDASSYRELIVNQETGEVIRECVEPLVQHRGHGSAKLKKASEKAVGK